MSSPNTKAAKTAKSPASCKCPNAKRQLWSHGDALPPHSCPYASEINDDHTLCRCCERCTDECARDI